MTRILEEFLWAILIDEKVKINPSTSRHLNANEIEKSFLERGKESTDISSCDGFSKY
jgi:hypothetical protein